MDFEGMLEAGSVNTYSSCDPALKAKMQQKRMQNSFMIHIESFRQKLFYAFLQFFTFQVNADNITFLIDKISCG